jgi:hypothetical protein
VVSGEIESASRMKKVLLLAGSDSLLSNFREEIYLFVCCMTASCVLCYQHGLRLFVAFLLLQFHLFPEDLISFNILLI